MVKLLYRIRENDSDFPDIYYCGADEDAIVFYYAYIDCPDSFQSSEVDYTLEKYGYVNLVTHEFHPFAEPIKLI